MTTNHIPAPSAIALQPGDGEALWFTGFLATIKASTEQTGGRAAVIHHFGPKGSGSPLHVHHHENEWFYVLDGELAIWADGRVIGGTRRLLRVRPSRHPAHLHRQLRRRRALLAGHRASRLRGLHARLRRAGPVPHAAATQRPPRPPANDHHRRPIWHRHPRPARHPILKSQMTAQRAARLMRPPDQRELVDVKRPAPFLWQAVRSPGRAES